MQPMSKPQHKRYPTTVFIVEGNPVAALVTGNQVKHRRFKSPAAALSWCRANRHSFVYTPSSPDPAMN